MGGWLALATALAETGNQYLTLENRKLLRKDADAADAVAKQLEEQDRLYPNWDDPLVEQLLKEEARLDAKAAEWATMVRGEGSK